MTTQTAFKPVIDNISWPNQSKYYNKEIHSELVRYIDRTGASLRDLVKEIRTNRTSLSQYLNYRYEGDLPAFERKIEAFLLKKAPKTVGDGICETSVSRILMSLFNFCQTRRAIGAGVGESGVGKTTAMQVFARKNPNTTIITIDPTRSSITKILKLISHRIQSTRGGSADELLNGIIDKLRNSRQFLIFDESHFLSWSHFEAIRAVWDATSIGIVYLGMPRLYSQMKGQKAYLWDQIFSRISIARSLNIITREDVKLITDSICPGLSKSCHNYLHEIVQRPGRLRIVTALLKQANEISQRQQIPLTVDLLKDVRKIMHIWR
ncbi:MAG: AAA family ATPase [Candidatus Marinimicrobia bacterium]|nr:AAA family ATPase [Candidatus Neomarinimicrobiota bacterium]